MESGEPASARSRLLGARFGAETTLVFDVEDVDFQGSDRQLALLLTVRVTNAGRDAERWVVTLGHDHIDADLLGDSSPSALDEVVRLVHICLEEWWHTKSRPREAISRKMGRRIG